MSSFIYSVTFEAEQPLVLGRFWAAVTDYAIVHERPDFVKLQAPGNRGVRHLLFLRADHRDTGRNRMHVDLGTRDPNTEIHRLVSLGAQLVDPLADGKPAWREGNSNRWVVLKDPEGNEFCVG